MMPNENRRTCDVAVIGGGPAGAAMATWLARSGHACVVLERAAFPRYPIGDALIPHTLGPLDILGSFEAGLWECVNTLRRLNHAVLTIDFTSQTSPTATLSPAPP